MSSFGGRIDFRGCGDGMGLFLTSCFGMIACFVALLALVAGWMAMRKGHVAVLFGLTALLAPPLGLALAVAVPRRGSPQGRDAL